jgi:hypothetical protein
MILIHPPVAKPCEPPAGIAKLSGSLTSHGIKHTVLDANLEALLYIIDNTHPHPNKKYDRWTVRAFRNISINHKSIKNRRTFQNIDRYKRAVIDLNHAIERWADRDATPSIANYRDTYLSPVRSDDLIQAAERPEENPYYPYFSKRLPSIIESDTRRIIGISLNYLSQALTSFAIIGFLKANFPGLSFVLGGGLVTSWMKRPDWRSPFRGLIDHLVAGSGERRLLEILGVDYIKEEPSRPDYGSLPLEDYLSPGIILPYSASRGCYWNKCSFCPENAEKSPYVPVPVDTVMKDLDELITETKPLLLHLVDNAISTSLLKRFDESGLGVPWYGFARVSHLLTDIDFCMDLKKSGCVMLKIGLESGDQGVLDRMNKGIDIETASTALKTLKKAGITTYVYLIFGTPAETITAARNTLEFVTRHKDEIGFLNVALFNMPLSEPEVKYFQTSSFYEGDLSLYSDYSHPENWNRKEVRRFLDDEFRKNRAVSGILIKNPPIFTSNHAPFFVM